MNKKGLSKSAGFFIVVFLLIIIIGGIIMFVLLRRDNQDPEVEIPKVDYYLKAIDVETGEYVHTNYAVVFGKTLIRNGSIMIDSTELISLPQNMTPINIMNYGNVFYVNKHVFISPGSYELELMGIGNVTAEYEPGLNPNGGSKDITLFTNKNYRGIGFCARWSTNILKVDNYEYPHAYELNTQESCENQNSQWDVANGTCSLDSINIFPQRFKNKVDKCWYPQYSITKDSNFTFTLHYYPMTEIGSGDYIDLYIFDSDRNYLNSLIVENMQGEDVGGLDYKFTVN